MAKAIGPLKQLGYSVDMTTNATVTSHAESHITISGWSD